ncbi:MAG: hypothetical protein ACI9FN_004010, partial [Saprospiraceae bacterium]
AFYNHSSVFINPKGLMMVIRLPNIRSTAIPTKGLA